MADEPNAPDPGAPEVKPEAKPAAAPEPKPATKASDLPEEALAARLERERKSTESRFLSSLGFQKVDDLKAKLDRLDALETEKLSESEKRDKRIAELEPRATRAAELEQRLAVLVEGQFAELPESARTAIDAVANGNAEKRLELMQVMRAAGLAQPASPAAQLKSPPANTAPPVNPPKPAGTETAWDKYAELKSPIERQIFYRAHRAEIEANRPA